MRSRIWLVDIVAIDNDWAEPKIMTSRMDVDRITMERIDLSGLRPSFNVKVAMRHVKNAIFIFTAGS